MSHKIPEALEPLLPSCAALDRLVYLVGPVRGGTSILHRAMNIHPCALVPPTLSNFMPHVWRYRNKVHDRLLRGIMRMPEWWNEYAIRQRLGQEQFAFYLRTVNSALSERDLASMYKLYPITFALNPEFKKDPKAIVCWHDKQNDWRYLNTIARAFPHGKFIFVARDPRSVALSAGVRAAVKSGEIVRNPRRGDLVGIALYWRFLLQRCLDVAGRYPDRCLLIRYEDFLTTPAKTLNRIFSFTVGKTIDEAAIESGLRKMIGAPTNSGKAYSGINTEPLARWKTELHPEDISLVERFTAPTARKLGYDIERTGGLVSAFRSLDELSGRSMQIKAGLKTLLSEAYELQIKAPT